MSSRRAALPLIGFLAYATVSVVMVHDRNRPLLPPPLGGKVQLSDVIFPLALAPWLLGGLPGLGRVGAATVTPVTIWVSASVATAAVAVSRGAAWREAAAFAYLGVVLIWGAAVLSEPARLRLFVRWWAALVAAVVLIGLAGWLVAVLSGQPNLLVEWRTGVPLFGDVARIRSTLVPTSRLLITLLILALPVAVLLRRQGMPGERRWAGWLLLAMTVCAVLTYARGLVEFLALLGLLVLLPWTGRRRTLALALVGIYVVALVGVLAVSTWHVTDRELTWRADRSRSLSDRRFYGTMPDVGVQTLDLRVEWVHDNYLMLKRVAWRAFLERPLTGWGPDNWPMALARARESGIAPASLRFDSAHGEAFNVAAEMGVIGLVALVAFWILVVRAMRPPLNDGFAATLARYQRLGVGAVLLTTLHLDVMRFRFLWIALALGIAAAVCAREEALA